MTQFVQKQFDHIATAYDEHAVVYKEVARRLVEKLDFIKLSPNRMLDLGAGTGYVMNGLAKRFPEAMGVSVDLSYDMLKQGGKKNRVQADSLFLPFLDASVELVMSNLMLPWCEDVEGLFKEVRRILKPGGLFLFSTFGPDTFQEWGKTSFPDMHDVGDRLLPIFADPVMDVEKISVYYASLDSMWADLDKTASSIILTGNTLPCQQSGKYPLSFEVVYGHAWKPEWENKLSEEGEIYFPISRLRK